jgi:uncharacterized protein
MSDAMLDILERHAFSVTVSLDGPPEVHDQLRPDNKMAPTHGAILRNIDALRRREIPPEFECTYTARHLACGVTVVDLLRYFAEQFGSRVLHVPLVAAQEESCFSLTPERATPLWVDAVRESVASLAAERPRVTSMVSRWIRSLDRKQAIDAYCPAGVHALTVQADGAITPCFMLAGDRRAHLGTVDRPVSATVLRAEAAASVAPHNKWSSAECSRCWLQPLCFGCIGEDCYRGPARAIHSAEPGCAPMCDLRRACGSAFFAALGAHHEKLRRGIACW